jgi:hypothetical protein
MPSSASEQPRILADIIMEKIEQHEAGLARKAAGGVPSTGGPRPIAGIPASANPKIVEVYTKYAASAPVATASIEYCAQSRATAFALQVRPAAQGLQDLAHAVRLALITRPHRTRQVDAACVPRGDADLHLDA